ETPAAPTPSTTTTTTEPGDPVRMTLPPVEDFIDDPALVEFFRWLPDAGLFELPGPTLLVLVEAGFGSPERLDTSVPGTAAFGIWDGDAALDRFLEEMAEDPGLDGSLTIEDLPQGIVVYPRFPTRPLAELAAPYLA